VFTRKRSPAFTLIEAVVVLAIIAAVIDMYPDKKPLTKDGSFAN
jgi:hypothetical protein